MTEADIVDLRHEMVQIAAAVDDRFDQILQIPDDGRARLYQAMRHAAIGGGKRLRPLLVVATARLFSVDREQVMAAAAAVELLHVYSLIHDDLPAMDDDDLRRGKPTTHIAFGEAAAILAGDALQALAFEILGDRDIHAEPQVRADMLACLARAAGPSGMAGGQMMDLMAEKSTYDLAAVTQLQRLKTGALIVASVEIGALFGGASAAQLSALRGYAEDIGLAFQIADDILDVTGDETTTGKAVQKDAAAGKATFVSLLGLGGARAKAQMLVSSAKSHLDGFDERADILRAIAEFTVNRDS